MVSRRDFFKGVVATLVGAAAEPEMLAAGRMPELARPTLEQSRWHDLELGMFVHFAPNTWQDREYDDLSTPLSAIDGDIDTDQWAECALGLGARYIVFVAKHAGGFCMWPTTTTDYSIRNTSWRKGHGDVMEDLAASCRKRGLKLGVYLSPQDRKFGAGSGGRCKTPEQQSAYNAIYRQQLTELLTGYGELIEIWFDGSSVIPVADILKARVPRAMIFQGPSATIRWVGNEDGFAPYPAWNSVPDIDAASGVATAAHGDPDGAVWLPNEVDVSIRRPNWFWSTKNQRNLLSLESLLDIYYRSVGRGAQLLLNIPPDRRGLVPDADFARAREFGNEIRRRFGRSIAETSGSGNTVTVPLAAPGQIDHVVIEEECAQGERVRRYRLEARTWNRWVAAGTGSAIGHKRIHPISPTDAQAVRLIVTESVRRPTIRRLAVFNVGAEPPPNWDAQATVWADDEVGKWSGSHFAADLSGKIAPAARYRFRLAPRGADAAVIIDPVLLLDGVPHPRLLRRGSSPDVLIISGPAARAGKVRIEGQIRGEQHGILLLRRF